jgi:hypothetical protein
VELDTDLRGLVEGLQRLQTEHLAIAGRAQAAAKSRAASLELTWRTLAALSANQEDLLKEAVQATEYGLYRSAHVSAFAALADALYDRLDRLACLGPLQARYPSWHLTSIADLEDTQTEHAVADAAKQVGCITKAQLKFFHGLLHQRNQCAHPTGYAPDLDQTLGYLKSVFDLIRAFA